MGTVKSEPLAFFACFAGDYVLYCISLHAYVGAVNCF